MSYSNGVKLTLANVKGFEITVALAIQMAQLDGAFSLAVAAPEAAEIVQRSPAPVGTETLASSELGKLRDKSASCGDTKRQRQHRGLMHRCFRRAAALNVHEG